MKLTLKEFIERWWEEHPGLENTEMGFNGQFDELPYIEYGYYCDEEQPIED